MDYRTYRVQAADRGPLLKFIVDALEQQGCTIIEKSKPDVAPFRVSFVTPEGERLGVLAYAFLANTKVTKNRPEGEHRFQVKYGSKDGALHELHQDPFGLYTTLFCGINPELGFFVGADPVLHNPTKFFISIEFKQEHVDEIVRTGWTAWERDRRSVNGLEEPTEVLVGGTASSFLRYVRFERDALGEEPGHRQLLAETVLQPALLGRGAVPTIAVSPSPGRLHALAAEFDLSEREVLDLIGSAHRLKMAVRGFVAEEHLVRTLSGVPGVDDCRRLDEEGGPDVSLRFEGGKPLKIECKNALRRTAKGNVARVDFQRTRASKADPCSRYYRAEDFDLVAACLHAVTLKWDFRYVLPNKLDRHTKCPGRISNNVRVDERWLADAIAALRAASA